MLSELNIQNIAVIQKASITFSEGLNVFTGETGAGKSILLGAIGAVLGERTSKDLIRTGEDRAQVSALFTDISQAAADTARELGYEVQAGEELLIQREIMANHNSCRVNGKPATVAMLRTIGATMITTHGQQDNQMLSSPDSHRRFVDAFGSLGTLLADYRQRYHTLCSLRKQLDSFETDESEKMRKSELLRYQIEEITASRLTDGEEEEWSARRRVIRNSAELTELLSRCHASLSGDEEVDGVLSLLDEASQCLEEAGKYLEPAVRYAQSVSSFRYELDDIAQQVRGTLEELEYDPNELENIEERLDLIGRLKRKYGANIREILSQCEKAQDELSKLQRSDELLAQLTAQYTAAEQEAVRYATALTKARAAGAERMMRAVTRELASLDMPFVRFEISMDPRPLGESGADAIEFLFSVNPGEAAKPLAKIASGGEMSRIMLAIKSVISGQDDIDTLIFDEVDAGISGRAAQKVGAKLRAVAVERQVICVTHLAQVAAFAGHHLMIEKKVSDGRTFTEITPLDRTGRIRELARIASGEPITELTLQSAAQLLDYAQAQDVAQVK